MHEWVVVNVLIQPSESLWTELSNYLSNAVATVFILTSPACGESPSSDVILRVKVTAIKI